MELLDEAFYRLQEIAELINLNIKEAKLTLDSGFDSERNHTIIEDAGLVPVIKPNRRGTKNEDKLHEMFEKEEGQKAIYRQRYKIERTFAWEDTYRKTVTRYEKRSDTHMGFKYLAYSLINLRWFLKRK
jgi:Transposase DDE domain